MNGRQLNYKAQYDDGTVQPALKQLIDKTQAFVQSNICD